MYLQASPERAAGKAEAAADSGLVTVFQFSHGWIDAAGSTSKPEALVDAEGGALREVAAVPCQRSSTFRSKAAQATVKSGEAIRSTFAWSPPLFQSPIVWINLVGDFMSHISSAVEYALHCLLHLAESPSGVGEASVRDLAELQGLSVDYVAKLFTKLHKAGLTVATEGARGGFRLARSANKISVLDVVVAVDGPKPLFDCREIRANCAVFEGKPPRWATHGICSINAVMLDAQKRMTDVLAAQTLAGLAENVAAKAPRSYQTDIVRWIDRRTTIRRAEAG